MRQIKIAPSMLSADFSRFGEEVKSITVSGADLLHLDIMDGSFVKMPSMGCADNALLVFRWHFRVVPLALYPP